MASEVGRYALILALLISATQAAVPFMGTRLRDPAYMAFADQAALAQFAFVATAFSCPTCAFVTSDFSVEIWAANSHTAKPLLYKISGVWGNHEGSMVLWVLVLSLFVAVVA